MPADLWLQYRSPSDLTLRRERTTGADLYLQHRSPGDLTLRRPPERQAELHAALPPLQSQLQAELSGIYEAQLHGLLPPLQSQLQAEYANRAELHAALPPLISNLESAYDNAVWRGIESPACARFQPGAFRSSTACDRFRDISGRNPATVAGWRQARPRSTGRCAGFGPMRARDAKIQARFLSTYPRPVSACSAWESMRRDARRAIAAPWRPAAPRPMVACSAFKDLKRISRPRVGAWFQPGRILVVRWCGDYIQARRLPWRVCGSWRPGRLKYGWGGPIVIVVPPPPPDPCRMVGRADLTLRLERTGDLVLRGCRVLETQGGTHVGPVIVIPVSRVYIVANDVHLIRVSDNLELPTFDLALGIDVDAWGWQFDAELPADQLANVQPGAAPVEVEVQINTYAWRFLVEDIRRTRSFGKSRIRISGRGPAAHLAAPYSPIVDRGNAVDLDATQILDDLLTDNGVPIGWTIDWRLTDWLVQAGAWNHSGTYMDGVKQVAEACGAVVQADRTAKTLHLIHRYPIAPWDWPTAAPAYTLPESVVVTEGVEWIEKPDYNAVYVSGETLGILGHVVRSGTAGDRVAPMVTHPLNTAQEAARQRGIAILADTGRQAIYTLSVPLDPSGMGLGLLEPCQLIEYGPSLVRGLVRSTRITARGASVRQTVTVETRT